MRTSNVVMSFLSFYGGIQPDNNMFATHRCKNMNFQAYPDYFPKSTIRDILVSILVLNHKDQTKDRG